MPKAKSTSTVGMTSWWLSDGDEECPHCGQLYVYEIEFRCTHCDGPGCPHCRVVHSEGHIVCPECVEASASKGGSDG
jgi:hypothetical protein